MKRFWIIVASNAVVLSTTTVSAGDKLFTAILRGNYTTSSKIFFSPDAPTAEQRAQFVQLEGIAGGGLELRYHWPGESFFFSLSVDYLSKSHEQMQEVAFAPLLRVPLTEGFHLIPVELGLHTFIPLGSENMRLSMGGGIGAYYGGRILRVAGVDAAMQNKPVKIGIHIASGFEYQVLPGIWVRGDMRFRDPELRTVNHFSEERTLYNDAEILFPRGNLTSRIDVNGMTFSLGMVVEFW